MDPGIIPRAKIFIKIYGAIPYPFVNNEIE